MKTRLLPLLLLALCLSPAASHRAAAQEMHDSKPSDHLELRGLNGTTMSLSVADLKTLPHKTVNVFNAHIKKNESYTGVELADLLRKLQVPLGEDLKGKLFMTGVVGEGTDGYKVLYSLAEVDPAMHTGDVIVADMLNSEPLTRTGAFQLINTQDKRPARWVRNLDSIMVVTVGAK